MKTIFICIKSAAGLAALAVAGCSSSATPASQAPADASAETEPQTLINAADVPIDGLPAADTKPFDDGDGVFDLPFRPADGLGPLYVRTSCGACHDKAARGPGLVQKMAVVGADGVTASADQSLLAFGHTVRQGLAAGATTPIMPPADPSVKVTTRLGPPVLGRGFMEAIADAEIERVEAEQATRTDGIHGRINRVTYASQPNSDTSFHQHKPGDANLIGRFGLKARVVSLDDFTADAFQGDMGMTTPMRPTDPANPDGLTDDLRAGVDLDLDHVNRVAFYLRRIAIPRRVGLTDQGRTLFEQAKCSVCHVPSLRTRKDYPIAVLADVDAPVFTDMLLHDLGPALADGMTDGSALSTEWRTAPLIGMRFMKTFLHDGRASTLLDAVLAHEGTAKVSIDLFRALSDADRNALLAYVGAL
jgi:CxxC motif-containing protein (DUF1111 family)